MAPHPQEVYYLAGKEAPSSILINYLWRCNYSEYGSSNLLHDDTYRFVCAGDNHPSGQIEQGAHYKKSLIYSKTKRKAFLPDCTVNPLSNRDLA